jgi:hypothetical protein
LVFSEKKFIGITEKKPQTLVLPAYRRLILLMMIKMKSIKAFLVLPSQREDSAKSFGYRFSQDILKMRPLPRLIPALSKTSVFLEEIFYE